MTMADSSDSSRRDDDKIFSVDHADPPPVSPLVRSSASHTFTRGTYDRDRRACNLDLNNSPSLRPGSAARDSGYNTDVSPAATISPATNTPRQQHFVFDNISHNNIPELEDRISSLSHISPYTASGNIAISPLAPGPHSPYQLHFEQRSRCTPPLRLSPDIFKVGASPCRTTCLGIHTPSRPVSEASDTNRVQFDFESDNEEDGNNRREVSFISNRISTAAKTSCDHFDLSESCLGLPIPILSHDSDDGDDEDVFHKSDDILKNWGIGSEPPTPINRRSLSLRQRRYCSADDDDDNDSLLGACGGRDRSSDVLFHGANLAADRRRHSFNESSRGREPNRRSFVRKAASGSEIKDNVYSTSSVTCTHSESSLSRSQDVQPCHFDACDYRDSDCDNVFTFDDIDGDDDNIPSQPYTRDIRHAAILRDRSSHNSVMRTRLRRISVTAYLRLSSGCLLPWSTSINRVSVTTQTPHITGIMIQQILNTPVPLPHEAIGTAAAALRRRQSEGGLPPGLRHLPDIVPYVRDRAMSVPDAQTLIRMQHAREVGRELRRLSDEFHFGVFNLNSVREEADGRFQWMGPRFLNNPLTHVWAVLRQTFLNRPPRRRVRRTRGSPVDLAGNLASMQISEQSEDLPGD